jgi:hypothetical protein
VSLSAILIQSLEESIGVVWRVVVDNVLGVVRVNLVDIFPKLASWLSLYLLYLLETTRLHEGSLRLKVLGQHLRELGANVS